MKGIDTNPLNAESLGKNRIGPDKKNLLIPNDEGNRLIRKVTRGTADLNSSKVCIVSPASVFS